MKIMKILSVFSFCLPVSLAATPRKRDHLVNILIENQKEEMDRHIQGTVEKKKKTTNSELKENIYFNGKNLVIKKVYMETKILFLDVIRIQLIPDLAETIIPNLITFLLLTNVTISAKFTHIAQFSHSICADQ